MLLLSACEEGPGDLGFWNFASLGLANAVDTVEIRLLDFALLIAGDLSRKKPMVSDLPGENLRSRISRSHKWKMLEICVESGVGPSGGVEWAPKHPDTLL